MRTTRDCRIARKSSRTFPRSGSGALMPRMRASRSFARAGCRLASFRIGDATALPIAPSIAFKSV
ncbi:hypothetical protein [Cohnella massiliensis]|uniref:hypothetical protein n=1 Tax=Cohnella massiliensis TaxID=1816691 RepID=UPI001FEC78F1|nr:hypothetical protein [Cohnella massiliensis]